ncbi:hypothetical protein ACTD5D_02535 [Nocardia takedensis]|uniref:hypothetical protein n=1 Tax=Nocardia takedensis TaxID=259390 RepID=UPI003F75AC73
MAKNRRKRGDERNPARLVRLRMMLVVDRAEVRSLAGCLTLRISDVDGAPASIVVPGESAFGLLGNIREAVLDAEEQYWRVVVPYIKRLGAPNPDAVARAMSKWHRRQGWERAAKHVPPDDTMFLLTNAGHVAIGAIPPASLQPVLAIFDPLQLRRISQGMESAAHQALQELGSRPWPMRALAAHEFLGAQPWRQPDTYQDPSQEEAAAWMKAQYTEHLRRAPYVRPAENNLPL